MAFSHFHSVSLQAGGRSLSYSVEKTNGASKALNEAIAASQTDLELEFTLDVSACNSFWMQSDVAMTIETNDGTTPDDTIVLAAGVPYYWHDGLADSFELGDDVTSIFVTNTTAGILNIEAIYDPDP